MEVLHILDSCAQIDDYLIAQLLVRATNFVELESTVLFRTKLFNFILFMS